MERPALVIDRVIAEMNRVDWDKYTRTRPGLYPYARWAGKALKELREEISKHETWAELGPELEGPSIEDYTAE